MATSSRRGKDRYDTLNLLSYVCIDNEGKEWKQGMGRTLNISRNGLKLETHEPIETRFVMLMSLGIEEDLVDIRGKVVYCNRGREGRFESGIAFSDIEPHALSALERFIHEFELQED